VAPGDQPGWPRFETAELASLDRVPSEVREPLARIPRSSIGGHYRAAAEVAFVESPTAGRLIQFGTTGVFGPIYVNPASGAVLAGRDAEGGALSFVNSSLDQFTSTVRGLIDLFPFYDRSDDYDAAAAAAARASELIAGIDPPAAEPDTLWGTFVDDVANGDFATGDVTRAS
jgi:hypothetical protein